MLVYKESVYKELVYKKSVYKKSVYKKCGTNFTGLRLRAEISDTYSLTRPGLFLAYYLLFGKSELWYSHKL